MLRINEESRKWWILIAMGAVAGLIMLDETVVGVALPTLRADLAMSHIASHWVVSAYFLVFTGFTAAAGKLGDLLGLRSVLVGGLLLFGLVVQPPSKSLDRKELHAVEPDRRKTR